MFIYLVRRRGRVTWEERGGQRVNVSSCSDPNTLQDKRKLYLIHRRFLMNFTYDPVRIVSGLFGGNVLIEAVEAL